MGLGMLLEPIHQTAGPASREVSYGGYDETYPEVTDIYSPVDQKVGLPYIYEGPNRSSQAHDQDPQRTHDESGNEPANLSTAPDERQSLELSPRIHTTTPATHSQ